MTTTHIGKEIRDRVAQYQDKNAIYYKDDKLDSWVGISWNDFGIKTQKLSKALLNFGIEAKQNVAIFSENSPEWMIADIQAEIDKKWQELLDLEELTSKR